MTFGVGLLYHLNHLIPIRKNKAHSQVSKEKYIQIINKEFFDIILFMGPYDIYSKWISDMKQNVLFLIMEGIPLHYA